MSHHKKPPLNNCAAEIQHLALVGKHPLVHPGVGPQKPRTKDNGRLCDRSAVSCGVCKKQKKQSLYILQIHNLNVREFYRDLNSGPHGQLRFFKIKLGHSNLELMRYQHYTHTKTRDEDVWAYLASISTQMKDRFPEKIGGHFFSSKIWSVGLFVSL